jgi:hypothetical protein
MAIMTTREGIAFEAAIESDSASLYPLVELLRGVAGEGVHVLRDPTRGGVASALNEIAAASGVGVVLEDGAVPVPGVVAAACDLLGLDPLYVANEGVLVACIENTSPIARSRHSVPIRSAPPPASARSSRSTPMVVLRPRRAPASWTCCPRPASRIVDDPAPTDGARVHFRALVTLVLNPHDHRHSHVSSCGRETAGKFCSHRRRRCRGGRGFLPRPAARTPGFAPNADAGRWRCGPVNLKVDGRGRRGAALLFGILAMVIRGGSAPPAANPAPAAPFASEDGAARRRPEHGDPTERFDRLYNRIMREEAGDQQTVNTFT